MKYLSKIVYTIFLSLIFFACSQNENLVVEKDIPIGLKEMKEKGLSFEDMGKLHNEYLGLFMKNQPKYKYHNFNTLVEDIDSELTKSNSAIFEKRSSYKNFDVFNLKRKGDSNFNDLLSEVYDDNTTEKVRNLLDIVLNNNVDYESNKIVIDNYIKNHNLTQIEIETIELFTTVAKYSNDYWIEYDKYESKISGQKSSCDPVHQRYFGDAMGFLFGGGLGGIGMSWAIYAIQQDGGGGCIY